jgi:TPR repeat protein
VLGGCVIIPYTPPSETQHARAEVANPDQVVLSVGPRKFLGKMADALRDEVSRVEFLDGQTFIDTAAPEGGLTLALLSQPAARERIAALGADYLILLGEPEDELLKSWGGVVPYIGFYGAAKTTASTRYWAALIDLQTMQLVEQLTTTATGTDAGLGLFYGIFVVSDTGGSAQKGVVRDLAQALAAGRPDGPIRVVMLARERLVTDAERQAEARALALRERGSFPSELNPAAACPAFSGPAPPRAGEGLVYLYRPYDVYGSIYPLVVMTRAGASEYQLARIWSGGYFPYPAAAGPLPLWIAGKPQEAVTLDVAPGQTYYLRFDMAFWKWDTSAAGRFRQVDSARGASEVVRCRQLPSAREDLDVKRARAEDGYAWDQLRLAEYYEAGLSYAPDESLPRDAVEAYKWYTVIVTTEGVADSLRNLASRQRDRLALELSAGQIAEATRRAVEWQAAFATR